jgi:cytochrome c oxidase cbb3-type subunit I/II
MIRTLTPDVLRYGNGHGYSRLGETIYDHPFQWGSKRTGPDLAREGGKRGNLWHYQHLLDPRSTSPGSNMPAYPWLAERDYDLSGLPAKIAAQRRLGVPYEAMTRDEIQQSALEQGLEIQVNLEKEGAFVRAESQMAAMIAYLQKLGSYTEVETDPARRSPSRPFLTPDVPDAHRDRSTAMSGVSASVRH